MEDKAEEIYKQPNACWAATLVKQVVTMGELAERKAGGYESHFKSKIKMYTRIPKGTAEI